MATEYVVEKKVEGDNGWYYEGTWSDHGGVRLDPDR